MTPSRASAGALEAGDEGEMSSYGIVEEVVTLLGRMESDRVLTSQALTNEKERVKFLEDEIDRHAYKRMHDLPLAVQIGQRHSCLNCETISCERTNVERMSGCFRTIHA